MVLQKWEAIVDADLANEEDEFNLDLILRGPKGKIDKVRAAVTKALDDAMIEAAIDLRLGVDPESGHLVVLDPQDPQHIDCISITGDALKQRVEEFGGTVVSASEVQAFKDEFRESSVVSDDAVEDWEDDDELEEDDEIELDEEEDEVGSSPLV